jgi:hypothetical protein
MSKPKVEPLRFLASALIGAAVLLAGYVPTHGQEIVVPSKPADSKREPESKVVNKPDLRVGDTWVFHLYPYTGSKLTRTIKAIKDGLVYFTPPEDNPCRFETVAYTSEWGMVDFCANVGSTKRAPVIFDPPLQFMPFPVKPGDKWSLKHKIRQFENYVEGKAIGWEKVTVPFGTLDALKIEVVRPARGFPLKYTQWYAPDANNFVKADVVPEPQWNFELLSYTRGSQSAGK